MKSTSRAMQTSYFLFGILRQYGIRDFFELIRRRNQYYRWNKNTLGKMFIRENLCFNVMNDAKYAFRYFVDMDPSMWRELDSFLKNTKDRSNLLDIGAHYGLFSLAFCAQGLTEGRICTALALEPSVAPFTMLTKHVALNPNFRIDCAQIAAGQKLGSISMQFEGEHLVASGNSPAGTSVEVNVNTVDSIILEKSFVPDVIKVDVEGFEVQVLRGAVGLLTREDVAVFLEVHPEMLKMNGSSCTELVELLSGMKYMFFDLEGTRIRDIEKHIGNDVCRILCRKM